jgi:hypothetical protein
MTYEETRGKIPYIADEYEDMNMSKYTFPQYLYDHRTFIGTIDEIYEIDKKLALRLDANSIKYVGIILIRTTTDIGFLMVSYTHEPSKTREEIYAELNKIEGSFVEELEFNHLLLLHEHIKTNFLTS